MDRKLLLDRFAPKIAQDITAAGTPDQLLSDKEVASELRVSAQTMQLWRAKGSGPRFHKLSPKCVRYLRSDVVAWLEQRAANSTNEYPHQAGPGRPAKKRKKS